MAAGINIEMIDSPRLGNDGTAWCILAALIAQLAGLLSVSLVVFFLLLSCDLARLAHTWP